MLSTDEIVVLCAAQSQEEFQQYVRDTKEMTRQMEEDNDREVFTVKTSYERRLQEEKVTLHVRFSSYNISKTVLVVTVNNKSLNLDFY